MEKRVVEFKLPNGTTALARVSDEGGGGATKTRAPDIYDFAGVAATLEGLSDAIRAALRKAAPQKTTVELSLELAVKAGKLTGLLVEGEGRGALKVTLEWSGDGG